MDRNPNKQNNRPPRRQQGNEGRPNNQQKRGRGGQNQVLLTVNGMRALGHRTALVVHPAGELRRRAAECEHLEAGEAGPRVSEVLALFLCDRRDRSQHDHGRNRQFDGQRREAERAADRTRGEGEAGMKLASTSKLRAAQAEQRDIEGALQSSFRDLGDGDRRRRREGSLYQTHRLAGERGEASRNARLLESAHCRSERFLICRQESHAQ